MEWDNDKSVILGHRGTTIAATLDALAVISVVAVIAGAAVAASGLHWRPRAYFSIVATLFDMVFAYEFIVRAALRERPFPWMAGLSSVVPLLAVSGPFLSGLAGADFGAAAVRGFWLGTPPMGGLAVLAALRLLRVARLAPPSSAARNCARGKLAAALGIGIVVAGAVASDTLLIPGLAATAKHARQAAVMAMASAASDAERVASARAAGAMALRIDGRVLLATQRQASPSDYAVESYATVEAWFPSADDRMARGMAETVVALASLAAAIGYVAFGIDRPGASRRRLRRNPGNVRRGRLSDAPAGDEELAGILG
ncbi:MAG: hypothetical protein CVV51_11190, partial [Spirochaetae bacterium HGW-Spirochaetae-7]